MGRKKKDRGKTFAGAALIAITLFDVIPADELIGVPLGIALILDGEGMI